LHCKVYISVIRQSFCNKVVRMQLREALSQITEIRSRIAQTETFRGYRSATTAFSGMLAIVAATIQSVWIENPTERYGEFLCLWIGVAVISLVVTATELVVRSYRSSSAMSVELTRLAILQFLPCLVAGGLLTYVFVLYSTESIWMLPGLWAVLFSLGVFASCRLLPSPIVWVGTHYLISGILCLVLARGTAALSPMSMVVTFGLGQFLSASILYSTLERSRGPS